MSRIGTGFGALLVGFAAVMYITVCTPQIAPGEAAASQPAAFKIAIVQSKKDQASQFAALVPLLKEQNIDVSLVAGNSFGDAIGKFTKGEVDAMFCASGPAGLLLIMEAAEPTVRPMPKDGTPGCSVVVLAKKGAPKFEGKPEVFDGKKVIFASLATNGEFWFKALVAGTKVNATMHKASSHSAAIDALSKGAADYAIVKTWVWNSEKDKYEGLEVVGEDKAEHPENCLMVSKKANKATAEKVAAALLGVESSKSDNAKKLLEAMKVAKFVKTTSEDFKPTIEVLTKAGVTKDFDAAQFDKK